MPDDKKVTSGPLRCTVQQLMHIAAINYYLGLGAHIFLKFGDLLGSVADECLLPLGKNIGPSRAVNLHAAGDMNERKLCFASSGGMKRAKTSPSMR